MVVHGIFMHGIEYLTMRIDEIPWSSFFFKYTM